MKIVIILFILFPSIAFSQSKDDFINRIIKINRLENEILRMGSFPDSDSLTPIEEFLNKINPRTFDNNYKNFQALTKIISHQELRDLTRHPSGVMRVYAIQELVKRRDYNFDFYKFFLLEFILKDTIESRDGCEDFKLATYSQLLWDWSGDWNYAISKRSVEDQRFLHKILEPIDSFILMEKFDFGDRVYENILNRKISTSMHSRLVEMIDSSLNFNAFDYLKKNDPALFSSIEKKTLTNVLSKKEELFNQHILIFKGYLRHMVYENQLDNVKEMILVVPKDQYFEKKMRDLLWGISRYRVDRLLENLKNSDSE